MRNFSRTVLMLATLSFGMPALAATAEQTHRACAKTWGGNPATGVCESVSERGTYAFFAYDWRGINSGNRIVFASADASGCKKGRTFGMRFAPEFNGRPENLRVDDYAVSADVRLILSPDGNGVLQHPGRANAIDNFPGWMIQLRNCRAR